MGKILFYGSILVLLFSCKDPVKNDTANSPLLWSPYNDSAEVAANRDHKEPRMRFTLVQSKVLDKNEVFRPLYGEVSKFSEKEYGALKPLILEQDIPTLQAHIQKGSLSYEKLVLFYLYRIYRYELDNATTLNTITALNPNVVEEARALDARLENEGEGGRHPIFGMPILLKDNINTEGMKTTAGSIAMMDHEVGDAFIVRRLKEHGALILGKVNLSEWAYFLCDGCPLGYSAVGGQTLNPYGRGIFETGGSSSGSGTSVAANYAVAAVGTETSGSILSPSGHNSVVGLKPTVGLLSRTGIVPISSTLDTPGPMTKNVADNAILLSAMTGKDAEDPKSSVLETDYYQEVRGDETLKGKRLGAIQHLVETDSVYKRTVASLKEQGAEIVEFSPMEITLDGFLTLLNIDMRNDLPVYLRTQVKDTDSLKIRSIADAISFNAADSLTRIPYGQALFHGIMADATTMEELEVIKEALEKKGRLFFDGPMEKFRLDAVLSVNNQHAGLAAVAKYPAMTVPMGYRENGEPVNLTFIGRTFQEALLLRLGHAFEQASRARRMPEGFDR